MSERDSLPSVPNDDPSLDDALLPEPIPRAGMGINKHADFSAPLENPPPAENPEDETAPALETIPELAPLAANSVTGNGHAHAADEMALDEFDLQHANKSEKHEYSGPDDGDGEIASASETANTSETASANEEIFEEGSDLFSHLAELRARILYSVAAVALASVVTWNFGSQIQSFLARPIIKTLKSSGMSGSQLVTLDPTEGFYLYFQITLVAAVILAAPFILFQIWRFIEPALTKTERRYSLVLIPFSVTLFFAGVTLGYLISPLFFNFFVQFQPAESIATFSYGASVALLAKMLLVFGICFQVPIVTIFLNKIGLVSRNFLIEYWRHAVVVIFLIVAALTPTWDPMTLFACALPPCLLYGVSIWMVKWL